MTIKITPIRKDVFAVQSHTNKNVDYEVNVVTKTCSCPHFEIRLKYTNGETCKHYDDLMKHINKLLERNETIYTTIEDEIKGKQNNLAEWQLLTEKFDENTIDEMIRIGRLYHPKKGFLSVL